MASGGTLIELEEKSKPRPNTLEVELVQERSSRIVLHSRSATPLTEERTQLKIRPYKVRDEKNV